MATTTLTVYGGLVMRRGYRRQVRCLIAARSAAAARRSLAAATGATYSYGYFRDFWAETGNERDLAAATAAGEGVVIWSPEAVADNCVWRPWDQD